MLKSPTLTDTDLPDLVVIMPYTDHYIIILHPLLGSKNSDVFNLSLRLGCRTAVTLGLNHPKT